MPEATYFWHNSARREAINVSRSGTREPETRLAEAILSAALFYSVYRQVFDITSIRKLTEPVQYLREENASSFTAPGSRIQSVIKKGCRAETHCMAAHKIPACLFWEGRAWRIKWLNTSRHCKAPSPLGRRTPECSHPGTLGWQEHTGKIHSPQTHQPRSGFSVLIFCCHHHLMIESCCVTPRGLAVRECLCRLRDRRVVMK